MVQADCYKFVSIGEARSLLLNRRFDERFVVVTLDDGYRDVKLWAQPILRKYGAPYVVHITTDFADGIGNLWWHDLESILAANDRLELDDRSIECGLLQEKYIAYAELEKLVLSQPCHISKRAFMDRLAARHSYDRAASARSLCMDWDEVREMSTDPLATIGAHTTSHPLLAKAPTPLLRAELDQSRRVLEDKMQRDVLQLAYPYGSASSPRSKLHSRRCSCPFPSADESTRMFLPRKCDCKRRGLGQSCGGTCLGHGSRSRRRILPFM